MNACGAVMRKGNPCTKDAIKVAYQFLPLCQYHLSMLTRELRNAKAYGFRQGFGSEINRTDLQRRHAEAMRASARVYFIRAGKRIKIGVSQNPDRRLQAIRCGGGGAARPLGLDTSKARLLATESGGPDRERELHKKFASLRDKGEWFRSSPELLDYINSLKTLEEAA